jgi:hypothetical protein
MLPLELFLALQNIPEKKGGECGEDLRCFARSCACCNSITIAVATSG